MDAVELARNLARGGRIHEIGSGSNRTFRVFRSDGTSLLKVYGSPGAAKREARAFEALAELEGLPQIVERAESDGLVWMRIKDPGLWTLDTLPENLGAARQAGAILKGLHELGDATLSNLSGGMTGEQVASDHASLFARLERYRGRLGIPASVIEAARTSRVPRSSEPGPAHTNPRPEKFHVAEDGTVTLLDWAWATVVPPEWDFSLAFWTFSDQIGSRASQALAEGYGASLSDEDLAPWIVYHLGSFLLREAEGRSGRLDNLSRHVDHLTDLVG